MINDVERKKAPSERVITRREVLAMGAAAGGFLLASAIPTPAEAASASVSYRTHVQKQGWQGWRSSGSTSGTTGKKLRLEAIQIKCGAGTIEYRTHVQRQGWQGWRRNGQTSGTTGKGLRIEAIQIRLVGAAAQKYDVWYRVHAQKFGWKGWAKNGASAGTAGCSYRLEAIQVKLVAKGSSAPGPTAGAFYDGNAANAKLKENISAYLGRGEQALTVYVWDTKAATNITLSIKGEKYTKKARVTRYGDGYGYACANFDLKKYYGAGTQYTITAKTTHAHATKKLKVANDTNAYTNGTYWSCKNYLPVKATGLLPGDKVILKIRYGSTWGEETYSHTVSNAGSYYTTFYAKYNIGAYHSYNLIVKNKAGTTLYDSGRIRFRWNR